jgi:hypothetical protein
LHFLASVLRFGHRHRAGLLLLTLAFVVVLVGAYLFGPARFWFSSDDAVHCLMAEVAVRQGRYLPKDWVVVNGDLPILPPFLLVYPILGVSYAAHALSALLTYLFLLASLAGFCQRAYGDLETTLITTMLVASGLSVLTLEFLIAQGGAYTTLPALSLCLYGLALERAPAARSGRILRITLVALTALLLTVTNPLRAFILTLAPLAMASVATRLAYHRTETGRGSQAKAFWAFGLPAGMGALGGTWLHDAVLLPMVTNVDAVATTGMAPLSQIAERLRSLPGAWLSFLQPLADRRPASAFENGLSLGGGLLAIGLVAGVAFDLGRPRKLEREAYRVAWLAASCIVLPLGALVVSSSLHQGTLEIRYAILGIVLAVPVTVSATRRALARLPSVRALAMVALAGFSVALAAQWHSPRHSPDYLVAAYRERQALLETLARHNVGRVLATHWNAYVLSVLSRGALQAFPVVVTQSGIARQIHFSYLGVDLEEPGGGSAIALADSDVGSASTWGGVREQFGSPRLKARSGSFRLWIYDRPRLHWALGAGPRIDTVVPESRLGLEVASPSLGRACVDTKGCALRLGVKNTGQETLSSRGERPLRIGVQALDRAGRVRLGEVARASFESTLASGESADIVLLLPRTEDAEIASYRVCLLQEPATWLCPRTTSFAP